MAGNSKSTLVRMVSSAGTGTFYLTAKTRNVEGKMTMRKYDKKTRKVEVFNEKKDK